jgi:hypothetical protein
MPSRRLCGAARGPPALFEQYTGRRRSISSFSILHAFIQRSVSSMISFDNIQVSRLQKPGQRNRGAPHGQNRPRPSDHHPQFRSLNCRAQ